MTDRITDERLQEHINENWRDTCVECPADFPLCEGGCCTRQTIYIIKELQAYRKADKHENWTPNAQDELAGLVAENKTLKAKIQRLEAEID